MYQNIHLKLQWLSSLRLTRYELTVYAIICIFVVLWCYVKWNLRRFEKVAAKLNGPPSYPILGSALEFSGSPEQVLENIIKILNNYGPEPFRVWLGASLFIILCKPEDIQIVLNSSKALEKGHLYTFFKNIVGEGLFTAPVQKWHKNRRIITPMFSANNLDQFFPVIIKKSQILIQNLMKEVGKTEQFDLWDYIQNTSLSIVCQTAMDYDLDTQSKDGSEFINHAEKICGLNAMRIYNPWLYSDFIFLIYEKLLGLHKLYNNVRKLPNKVIDDRIEKLKHKKLVTNSNVIIPNDGQRKRHKMFLDTLLVLNEVGANFSDDELKDEVMTLMIAGSDTNSITICFCLLMLAIHQEIQDKVYDEIYEVVGDSDEAITIEEINLLVYLEQAIKETLRMYPVGPLMFRQLRDNLKISSGDLMIPKGTTVVLSSLGTHHTPEYYPNSWAYNPENFNPENVKKRHKFSFLGFSGGPRGCIGSKYGMLSMKVLLSTFLRNFSVHTNMKLSDIKLKINVIMRSSTGYPVTVRIRDRRPTYKRN